MNIVSKENAESGFGARVAQHNHAMDAHQPGDVTEAEETARRNQEMIPQMIAEETLPGNIIFNVNNTIT